MIESNDIGCYTYFQYRKFKKNAYATCWVVPNVSRNSSTWGNVWMNFHIKSMFSRSGENLVLYTWARRLGPPYWIGIATSSLDLWECFFPLIDELHSTTNLMFSWSFSFVLKIWCWLLSVALTVWGIFVKLSRGRRRWQERSEISYARANEVISNPVCWA